MTLLNSFTDFELFLLFSLIPAAFIFMWTKIFGDFKNFEGSRKAYSEYLAKDPVNCYQNFSGSREKKTD